MTRYYHIKKMLEVETTIKIEEEDTIQAKAIADQTAGEIEVILSERDSCDFEVLTFDYHTWAHTVEVEEVNEQGELV